MKKKVGNKLMKGAAKRKGVRILKANPRDDFSPKTRLLLAARANNRCSIQNCNKLCVGPALEEDKAFDQGTAAHIYAASPHGGPRPKPDWKAKQRKDITNGIWCCATHGRLIDSDESRHSAEQLIRWKKDHEARILLEATGRIVGKGIITSITLERIAGCTGPATIQLSGKNLLVGNGVRAKKLVSDLVAGLCKFERAASWWTEFRNNGGVIGIARLETFSGTLMKWTLTFGERVLVQADGNCVASIISGFRIIEVSSLLWISFKDSVVTPYEKVYARCAVDEEPSKEWLDEKSDEGFVSMVAEVAGLSPAAVMTALELTSAEGLQFLAALKVEGGRLFFRSQAVDGFRGLRELDELQQQHAILDVILRIAEFSAKFAPTVVVLEQGCFCNVGQECLQQFLDFFGGLDLQAQMIVSLDAWPAGLASEHWSIWELA